MATAVKSPRTSGWEHALASAELSSPALVAEELERLYRQAGDDPSAIPWYLEGPHPALVAWLNAEACSSIRPGASVVVAGCGLGDDVEELACRGYEVLGFDVAPSAINWARRRHPDLSDRFMVADLFNPPSKLLARSDLVVDVNTLALLPEPLRAAGVEQLARLARPHGCVLVIAGGLTAGESATDLPLFSPEQLAELFGRVGFQAFRPPATFADDLHPGQLTLCGAFRR